MVDLIGNFLDTLSEAVEEIGTHLGMSAMEVYECEHLSNSGADTGVTVFFKLAIIPLLDRAGELITAFGNILVSLADMV